jgi:hypothetical protein
MDTETLIGKVQSVDTGNISVKVDKEELLNSVQVNKDNWSSLINFGFNFRC